MSTYKLKSLIPNLMVTDVNQSLEFYQQVIGFDVVQTVPDSGDFDWAMVVKDDVTIMLQKKQSMQQEYEQFKDMDSGGSVIQYVSVENIESIYNTLKDKVEICKPLNTTFYGKREFSIQDPDGYVFTFSE